MSSRGFPAGLRFWGVIAVAAPLITVFAEGVHDVMLDHLHIPYPEETAVPGWAVYANVTLSTFAYLVFYRLAGPFLSKYRLVARCLLLGLVYLMLRETLRIMVINGFLTDSYGFNVIATLPRIILFLLTASLIAVAAPRLRGLPASVFGSAAIAAIVLFAAKPGIKAAFAPLLASLARFDLPERYAAPYAWQPLAVIYASFIEAVIATFVIAALAWARLPGTGIRRLLLFAVLVMAMKQSILPTLLFSFWLRMPLPQAILSESQFGLETLALAILVGVTWRIAQRVQELPAVG